MPLADDAALEAPLAVALGANQPSAVGGPRQTLAAVRPLLEEEIKSWSAQQPGFSWSPLIKTLPVGGPPDQPTYVNAVLIVNGLTFNPTASAALELLEVLHRLECRFGRDRTAEQRWGPRMLDLDLLFWGQLRVDQSRLVLPHPRLHLRTFVLEPLLAAMQQTHRWS